MREVGDRRLPNRDYGGRLTGSFSAVTARRFPPPSTERCVRVAITTHHLRRLLVSFRYCAAGERSETPMTRTWVYAGWRKRAVSFKAAVYALIGMQ
jgi:hypothetical protein